MLGHEIAHAIGSKDDGLNKMNHINNYENPMFAPFDGWNRLVYASDMSEIPRNLSPSEANSMIDQWNTLMNEKNNPFKPIKSNWLDMASGGFVLYPSKPNTNMMQFVYSK